jgi:hypothetical protein
VLLFSSSFSLCRFEPLSLCAENPSYILNHYHYFIGLITAFGFCLSLLLGKTAFGLLLTGGLGLGL